MRRRLFNFTAAVSLLLCLGTAVLWVRSLHYYDGLILASPQRTWILQTHLGWVQLDHWNGFIPGGSTKAGFRYVSYRIDLRAYRYVIEDHKKRTFADFGHWREDLTSWSRGKQGTTRTLSAWSAPIWFFTLLFAVLPLLAFMRLMRRVSRRSHGRCPSCGYDLTGNTSGVCPECGTPVESKGVPTQKSGI